MSTADNSFMRVLGGERVSPPPVWIMRQAGRYLPEYRAVRKQAGSFLDLCYSPALATEVTLQPIRRFGFDAAILFSDILVVPDGLGQPVRFEEGRGPVLEPVTAAMMGGMDIDRVNRHLAPVFEAIGRIRQVLDPGTALIGFCGAPWTVASYMIAGSGTPDQAPARRLMLQDPEMFAELMDILVESSIRYLNQQIQAGVDAVQIFDTWAGVLTDRDFERWVVEPTTRIVAGIRAVHGSVPIIGFPKSVGQRLLPYVMHTGVDCVGLDWTQPDRFVCAEIASRVAIQGNMDPVRLFVGGSALDREVDRVIEAFSGERHIFNLGHGITPDVPPEHVAQMIERIRAHG